MARHLVVVFISGVMIWPWDACYLEHVSRSLEFCLRDGICHGAGDMEVQVGWYLGKSLWMVICLSTLLWCILPRYLFTYVVGSLAIVIGIVLPFVNVC